MSVTETVTPSVRGHEKLAVAAALIASGALTGALAGFGAGVGWVVLPLPALSGRLAVALVVGAVIADALFARTGRPRPFSVRTQVPQAWSAVFHPVTVATLYGARLGIGPLTILPSWLWWAMLAIGAAAGPAASTLAGGLFGLTRGSAMLVAAEIARGAMPTRMRRLRTLEPAARVASWVLAVGAAGILSR